MLTTSKDLARAELARLMPSVKVDLILDDSDGGYDGFSLSPAYKGSRKIRQEAGRRGMAGHHRWVEIVPAQRIITVLMLTDCQDFAWETITLEVIDEREKVIAVPGEPEVINGIGTLIVFDIETDWA